MTSGSQSGVPRRFGRALIGGAAAGAAGTTALNGVTYLDMALRGRSTSSAPQDTIEALASKAGVDIPGDEDTRQDRLAGLGPLLGMLAGLSVGAALGGTRALGFRPNRIAAGLLAGAVAMAATDTPMAALGVTDPSSWGPKDWLADVVPHAAYGFVTAALLTRLDRH